MITEIKGTAGREGWKANSTLPWVLETAADTWMTIMDSMKQQNIKSLVNRQGKKKCSNPFFVVLLSSLPQKNNCTNHLDNTNLLPFISKLGKNREFFSDSEACLDGARWMTVKLRMSTEKHAGLLDSAAGQKHPSACSAEKAPATS